MLLSLHRILERLFGLDRPTLFESHVPIESRVERRALLVRSNVGKYSYVGPECRLFDVSLGAYASLGPRVIVGENEHETRSFSTSDLLFEGMPRDQYMLECKRRTEIGADAWVGANAFIRKGLKIGIGSIIGAHSVVLQDVEPYTIMVGVPARKVRMRFSDSVTKALLASKWWEYDRPVLQEVIASVMSESQSNSDHQDLLVSRILELLDSRK